MFTLPGKMIYLHILNVLTMKGDHNMSMKKYDSIPDWMRGLRGFLVEFLEKPNFFTRFNENDVKTEWFSETAFIEILESNCIEVITAKKMTCTECQKLYSNITYNHNIG